jgi:hypothetical protein
MKILKVWLKKSQLTKASNDFSAHVIVKGNMNVENIVDELICEGLELDKEAALDVIDRFNQKSADLVLSGFNVNTGLVNMHTIIKGPLYGEKWNQYINSVSVIMKDGYDLHHAITETKVEIMEENGHPLIPDCMNDRITISENCYSNDHNKGQKVPNHKIVNENTVGVNAFRTWLFKA